LHRHVAGVRAYIKELEPDLVHAMRIPFEGIFATKATPANIPLLISVWGNDFTLHAKKASLTKLMTRQSMLRADALHCDCTRDLHLARELGFDLRNPQSCCRVAAGFRWMFSEAARRCRIKSIA
jgi:hypothetical protein